MYVTEDMEPGLDPMDDLLEEPLAPRPLARPRQVPGAQRRPVRQQHVGVRRHGRPPGRRLRAAPLLVEAPPDAVGGRVGRAVEAQALHRGPVVVQE